jgi:hypothetical protein
MLHTSSSSRTGQKLKPQQVVLATMIIQSASYYITLWIKFVVDSKLIDLKQHRAVANSFSNGGFRRSHLCNSLQ